MTKLDKRPYRPDGGDIGIGRIKEIADNVYGDEEKCWLAKRVLALQDEMEAAEKRNAEMSESNRLLCADSMIKQDRIAEMEVRKVKIKLPASFYPDGDIDCPLVINEYQIIEAIVAADCKPIAVCPRCKRELDLTHKPDGAHYCHAAAAGKGE